jgi:hypothetical protein
MKVALIGNMNNNNFAVMRYLRDLGVDAYLLITDDDGIKSNAHFIPENDTINIERWRAYIKKVPIGVYRSVFRQSSTEIQTILQEYDFLIGSGMTPVIVQKARRKLDLFYPYTVGVEFISDSSFKHQRNRLKKKYIKLIFRYLIGQYLKILMKRGLTNCSKIITTELEVTGKTLNELGLKYDALDIPMLYNKENFNELPSNEKNIFNNQYDLVLFSHVSHVTGKNKSPILESLKLIKQKSEKNIVLFLVEYGSTIENTKSEIKRLEIEDKIVWIKPGSRVEIIKKLINVDIGFGEFEGYMWGGCGWEFLASGVPFFHYIKMNQKEFNDILNYPMPPIFNTISPEDICEKILYYCENKVELNKISIEMKEWFDLYGGIGLAKKWKSLIELIYQNNKNEITQ